MCRNGFRATGVADAGALAAALASRARQAFDPPIQLSVDIEEFEGVQLVVARIYETPINAKPCTVRKTGQAFLRYADGDYPLSRLEIDGFAANRTRPRFDDAVESLASGIPATIAALADADMPPPRFFDQGLAFTVTVDRSHPTEQQIRRGESDDLHRKRTTASCPVGKL